jgi:hypothetical protein
MSLEGNIASGLGIIAAIMTIFTIIGLFIAYLSGNLEGLMTWFANFLKDEAIAAPFILLIAAIVGIFSTVIASAIRGFSSF